MPTDLSRLMQFIMEHFNIDEVRTLCFETGVNYDDLGEERISTKVREMLIILGRQQRYDELLRELETRRPRAFGASGFSTEPEALDALYASLPSLEKSQSSHAPRPREEQILMEKVQDFWVDGVLKASLQDASFIDLDKEVRPDAVDFPWQMVVQKPGTGPVTLPLGTPIEDVFDEADGTLLILGPAGSGKTTTLLELARVLIRRAALDPALPVPVVLNISSWSKDLTVAEWLIAELNQKYVIPKKIGRSWLENDRLLWLIDGLDEVKSEFQAACIEAINQFRGQQLAGMVDCGRYQDYVSAETRLKLQTAVFLKPLRPEQIMAYLDSMGTGSSALGEMLANDESLQGLAATPLMLNVMTIVYRETDQGGTVAAGLTPSELAVDQRQYLHAAYVRQMFERRGFDPAYSEEDAVKWLAWLARKMSANSLSVFLMEALQPDWLPADLQRLHAILTPAISLALPFLAMVALGVRLFLRPDVGLTFGLTIALATCMSLWLAIRRTSGLAGSVLAGAAFGLSLMLTYGLNYRIATGVIAGLLFGVAGGLVYGLVLSRLMTHLPGRWDRIETVERVGWSWPRAGIGLVIGLITGALSGLVIGRIVWPPILIQFTASFTLSGGLIGGLFAGLTGNKIDESAEPNQGIHQSARNAVAIGLAVAIVIATVVGVITAMLWGLLPGRSVELAVRVPIGLTAGILAGIAAGAVGALLFGGLATIQHYLLRLLLWQQDYLPWDLARFLHFTTERVLMRRVGGGFVFVDRFLQAYFAGLKSHTTV